MKTLVWNQLTVHVGEERGFMKLMKGTKILFQKFYLLDLLYL